MIKKNTVVGIFDIEKTTGSMITRKFLAVSQKADEVISVTTELPRSYIVCEENGKKTVYLTQLSLATLKRRNESKENIF